MKEKEYNIKVTVYATKVISVDASSFQEACEIAETKMYNQINNYRVDFNYEFEESSKGPRENEDDYYDDNEYNYRYEHEQSYLDEDDDDIYENYN